MKLRICQNLNSQIKKIRTKEKNNFLLRSRGRLNFSELKNDGLLKSLALKTMDQRKPVYWRRKMDAYVRGFIIFVYIIIPMLSS